jgi:hypothetical protein
MKLEQVSSDGGMRAVKLKVLIALCSWNFGPIGISQCFASLLDPMNVEPPNIMHLSLAI